MELTREIVLPAPPEEVWESLTEPAWLGPDATIELEPAGEVRAGDRSGFVEEAEEPHRLVFWWSRPGEDATRVAIELEEAGDETIVRVAEGRPLAHARPAWRGAGGVRASSSDPRDDAWRDGLARTPSSWPSGDPTRRRLLALLGERGEASATELARELPVSRQAVQKHLGTLGHAGLVGTRRAGREVLYRPTPAADVRGDGLDGRGGRAVGRAPGRARAPVRRPDAAR